MTGRDLILYILENHLENEEIFEDGKLAGTLSEKEVAAKLCIGSSGVHTMCVIGKLKAIKIGELYYIFPDSLGGVNETNNTSSNSIGLSHHNVKHMGFV